LGKWFAKLVIHLQFALSLLTQINIIENTGYTFKGEKIKIKVAMLY